MAQTPGFSTTDPHLPPVKRSNSTVIWVVVIVCLAGFCIVALLVGAAILLPVFSQARFAAQNTKCLSNVKQLSIAQLLYAAENNDRFPVARDWESRTRPLLKLSEPIRCPSFPESKEGGSGYAFNRALSNREAMSLDEPNLIVAIFETNAPNPNASGGEQDVARPGRHRAQQQAASTFGFADGHVKRIHDGARPGKWNP